MVIALIDCSNRYKNRMSFPSGHSACAAWGAVFAFVSQSLPLNLLCLFGLY